MSTRTLKILYWLTTVLFVFVVSVPAALFFFTDKQMTLAVMSELGFSAPFFSYELNLAKALGGIALLLPMIPARLQEWAYVGFFIDTLSATFALAYSSNPQYASMWWFGLLCLLFAIASYVLWHKMKGTLTMKTAF